jgi:Domain of unknown function (DUF6268)
MKFNVVLFICSLPFAISAQSSIDLVTVGGSYGFPASYHKPLSGKATETGSLFNLKIPVVISDKTIWYNDLTYTWHSISTDVNPKPTDMLTSMNLHAFIFQTGIAQKINEKNGLQLLLVPRYTTDFEGGSNRKNWQLGAIGLYEHRVNERLLMRFGLMYNDELFGPLLVPLVYIDWQLSERLNITGLMPISLKVNYKINERLSGGYSHFGFITTYAINKPEFNTDYIERNSIDETLFIRWKMIHNLHLETRIGYSLSRVYAQYNQNEKMDLRLSIVGFGDNRAQKNVSFNSGPITSLRLVYNLPLKTSDNALKK